MTRRVPWWAWTLIGVATAAALGVAGVVSFIGFEIVTSQPVTIRNDESAAIRMSGNCTDDSLDLLPGQSETVDVSPGGSTSCEVYATDGYRYEGCMRLRYSQANATVSIKSGVEPAVSEFSCESDG